MPKLPTTPPLPPPATHPRHFTLCRQRYFYIFLCNWQSGREQQRKSICLRSLNVIALHVCTLSPTLLGSSTRRSLLSPHCSLRIWFSGSWSLDGISFISSRKEDFKGDLFFPMSGGDGSSRKFKGAQTSRPPKAWAVLDYRERSGDCFGFLYGSMLWKFGSSGRWGSLPPPTPTPHFTPVSSHPSSSNPPPRFEYPHKICKWTPNEIPFSSVSPSLKAFHQFTELPPFNTPPPPFPNTNHLCT